jgi:hypothetical protein
LIRWGRQVPAFPTAKTPSNTDTSTCPAPPQVALAVDHAVLWSVPGPNGGTSNFKFCYASVAINMPPASYGAIPASYNQIKLQSIVLPDGHTWNFQYNDPGDGSTYNNAPINYGTLTQITPTHWGYDLLHLHHNGNGLRRNQLPEFRALCGQPHRQCQ